MLAPAFMISELRRAFEIGFLLFLPFVIIDMVVDQQVQAEWLEAADVVG